MATRKAKPPASAEKQDVPARGDDVKITVKRKRRRLYDPVPEPAAEPAAAVQAAPAEAAPAEATRKTAKRSSKRPAKARRRAKAPAAAKAAKPAAKTPRPAAKASEPATKIPQSAGADAAKHAESGRAKRAESGRAKRAESGRAKRAESAQELIKKYSWGTAAAGLVPVPLIDLAASSVLQSRMLKALTELYEVEYSEQRARIFTGAMVGSVTSVSIARQTGIVLSSLLKSLPAVGLVAGATLMPAATGASTYALGRVFIQHFETGGTLLDFDPEKMRAYYEQQVAEAQASAEA